MKVHVLEVVQSLPNTKLYLMYLYFQNRPHCSMLVEHSAYDHAECLMPHVVVDIDNNLEGIDILDHIIVVLDLGGDD